MAANVGRAKRVLEIIIENVGPDAKVSISPAESAGSFSACEAALKAARSSSYRADRAPMLPLHDCDHPDRCVCVYSVQADGT
jgi:hypothetical protein